MTEEIAVAILGLVGSGLGSVIGVIASSKLTQYRIEQLEQKVQAHNNLIDRMYRVESQEEVIEQQIKVINHRISDLEHS